MKTKYMLVLSLTALVAVLATGCRWDAGGSNKRQWTGTDPRKAAVGQGQGNDGSYHERHSSWEFQDPITFVGGALGGLFDLNVNIGHSEPGYGYHGGQNGGGNPSSGSYFDHVHSCWVPNGSHVEEGVLNGQRRVKIVRNGCHLENRTVNGTAQLVEIPNQVTGP